MDLDSRKQALEAFASDVRILVSTDAGGEGLNLQFCHVVVNFDIPWNPMRLEQRIGRVDRIGQGHTVRALNLVLEDTVEFRVREVLEEKLAVILREFGVDKTGDVLDSADAGEIFDELYKDAGSSKGPGASRGHAAKHESTCPNCDAESVRGTTTVRSSSTLLG
jgi:SNF2 family DNA or RNA helicase